MPFPPSEMYSLEISFSASEHYEQLRPLRIPYLKRPLHFEGIDDASADIQADLQFPHLYKLLLKITPLEPVPAEVKVFLSFSDVRGNTYFGTLGSFHVSFPDMFLPVRLPPELWATLFEQLWMAGSKFPVDRWRPECVCRSVQVLHLGKAEVKKMLQDNLGAFVVPTPVTLEPEQFDFEQEEFLQNKKLGAKVEYAFTLNDISIVFVWQCFVLRLETVCVAVFVPPKYHLLIRCTSSPTVSVLRMVTDRARLLSYLDVFFKAWLPEPTLADNVSDHHEEETHGIEMPQLEQSYVLDQNEPPDYLL